ncbi:PREDICTED: protein tipE [Nicrophorus vespilloides]|uniref:Protein tipE n=1 Tax=Nicrophorus vespilloides TaxID=110193 RepID=A0ABM1MHI1_NICVS|nr:PREDICTED: protein tipE [Nicrophorus vespilloides]
MEEEKEEQTLKQKVLFYITAFFVLLGTFSLFSFLFLVPFVIDPAFTTIFMEFDEHPAFCVTKDAERRLGVSNCSWSSCREGCTKDIYDCTQIRVNYKLLHDNLSSSLSMTDSDTDLEAPLVRQGRAVSDDYDYYVSEVEPTGLMGNDSEWYYMGAKLFPNVKGCGYPPMLNCSVWLKRYKEIGTNFSCYYSRVDPGLVISHLDMWQVYMNLVYAMAIPIPSFILSVIYLTFAYFKIYNDDEETAPLEKNAEAMDMEGDSVPDETPLQPTSSGITPASEAFREDLASFGHHFKVAMADEMSRESFADGVANSMSIPGNLTTMTTSISMTGGPIADI